MTQRRDIFRKSRYARNEARELLQSVFVAELLRPSSELWLVSPWLSDIEVVDDTAGAFASLVGGASTTTLTLAAALVHLAEAGSKVRIVTRPDQSRDFNDALSRQLDRSMAADRVTRLDVSTLHTKGLVGEGYRVMGSMNFTFNGVLINDEAIHFDRDAEAVARARLQFEREYGLERS